MSLVRTKRSVRLKSAINGKYYTVPMVDKGNGVIIPEPDIRYGSGGASDAYLALRSPDDDQVYRWALTNTTDQDGQLIVTSALIVSVDQSESAVDALSLVLGSVVYDVFVGLQDDGEGNLTPVFMVDDDGEEWEPPAQHTIRIEQNLRARFLGEPYSQRFELQERTTVRQCVISLTEGDGHLLSAEPTGALLRIQKDPSDSASVTERELTKILTSKWEYHFTDEDIEEFTADVFMRCKVVAQFSDDTEAVFPAGSRESLDANGEPQGRSDFLYIVKRSTL